MKKIKLLFCLLAIFTITTPIAASAACSWTLQKNYPPAASQYNVKGCLNGEIQSGDDKCTEPKPADGVTNEGVIHGDTSNICCCNQDDVIAKPTEAKFIIPDFKFQVAIPGLDKLSTVRCTDKCAIPWISEYFFGVYNYLLGIAAVLAVVMLMAAGLLWIVSGGDASKVGQAKTMIAGSITGLLLLVSISLLLTYINPKLTQQGFVELTPIERKIIESLAVGRKNKTAQDYGKGCPTAAELSSSAGATIYATGYYKPLYNKNNKDFWCIIAMQCSCPKGVDTTKNCDNLYGKTFPNYHPCIEFDENTPYCNMTASGAEPQIGTIAGPNDCRGVLPMNSQVCFKGKTYTITDSGGGIKGRRIDIWSGNSLDAAYANTGVGQMTTGPCK